MCRRREFRSRGCACNSEKFTASRYLCWDWYLVLVQAVISLSPRKETEAPAHDTTPTVESKMTYAPGILGGVFLLGGIWIVFTSRRSDEPPAERAVK